MLKDIYSIDEVAVMTGLTTRTIRNYLNKGIISGEKVDGKWVFTIDNFVEMLENPYVAPAIRAKNNAPVFDFIKSDKKPCNSMCMIIDRCASNDEALSLTDNICRMLEEYNGVDFRFEKRNDNVRIILTGEEEQVKRIYSEISNEYA